MSEKQNKAKPRGKPFQKGDDPRRVTPGRPKDEKSVTHWLKVFGQLSPVELAQRCALYARELKKGGDDLPIFALIAIRQLMELMNDSDARLLSAILDRTEGKVAQPIEWREAAKQAGYNPDEILERAEQVVNEYVTRLDIAGSDSGGVATQTDAASGAA